MVIAIPDEVLVAPKDRAQDVKKVVEFLKMKNIPQADFSKRSSPLGVV